MRSKIEEWRNYCDKAVENAKAIFKANPSNETLTNYRTVQYLKKQILRAASAIDDANFYFKFIHAYLPKEHYNNMMYAASVAKKLAKDRDEPC